MFYFSLNFNGKFTVIGYFEIASHIFLHTLIVSYFGLGGAI